MEPDYGDKAYSFHMFRNREKFYHYNSFPKDRDYILNYNSQYIRKAHNLPWDDKVDCIDVHNL
eukprot:Awhi_evm1s4022